MKKSLLLFACIFAALSSSSATSVIYSTWDDATYNNGSFAWSDASHWSNGIPSSGANFYVANITHSTGDLVITTSTALLVGYDFNTGMNNSAFNPVVNSGSLTFKFGASFTTQGTPVVTNNTNDVSKLVFDVNDQIVSVAGMSGSITTYFTVKSSASDGGGTYIMNQALAAIHMSVENNVTLNIAGAGNTPTNISFSPTSTLKFTGAGFNFLAGGPATSVGNLIIGSTTTAKDTTQIGSGANIRVVSNVIYNTSTMLHADSLLTFGSSTSKLYVGGNLTDNGNASSDTQDYGNGMIFFNGGAGSQRTVSIGRTGLTTKFQIGENTSTFGNIAISQNLTTTGSLTILRGSRLNVGAFTMTAGSMDLSDNAGGTHLTIADTFGTTNGLLTTSGALSLNTFNLELTFDGTSWTNGSNLLLFHYGGTFTGALALGTITYNGPGTITSAGTLLNFGGNIYLQNVSVVPEPSSAALLIGACGGLIGWSIRRKNRK